MSAEEALAQRLLAARATGERIAALPAELVPATAAAAYRVQALVAPALGPIAGWKVGASSPDAEPTCAPLFAATLAQSPARFPARLFPLGGIEAELAFRLGRPLPPSAETYGEAEVWSAMASLHPAIELVSARFVDPRTIDKWAVLADNQANGAFCCGAALDDWRRVDFLSQRALLEIDGKEVARAVGGNTAGHPRRLLAWLANHCSERRLGLAAGTIITTGSHTGLVFAPPGVEVRALFPGIGEANLILSGDDSSADATDTRGSRGDRDP
jgi:2-keto-4-pentenoate hydratase